MECWGQICYFVIKSDPIHKLGMWGEVGGQSGSLHITGPPVVRLFAVIRISFWEIFRHRNFFGSYGPGTMCMLLFIIHQVHLVIWKR